jgi:hypothetical protein
MTMTLTFPTAHPSEGAANLPTATPHLLSHKDRTGQQQITHLASGDMVINHELQLFDHVDPNDYMWIGDGPRVVEKTVIFEHPFATSPALTYALSVLDCSQAQNLRFRLARIDLGKHGFKIALHTWDDTKIARAALVWQAIGPR